MGTTVAEVIRAAIPNAGDDLCDYIVWGRTPYPAGPVGAKGLYRAASGYIRARRNGKTLCDFCERPVDGGFACNTCLDRMNGESK